MEPELQRKKNQFQGEMKELQICLDGSIAELFLFSLCPGIVFLFLYYLLLWLLDFCFKLTVLLFCTVQQNNIVPFGAAGQQY